MRATAHSLTTKPFTIAVKPFDLEAALAGAPFIHRFDAVKPDAARHVSTSIYAIPCPEHPGYAVWSDEWLVYDDLDAMAEQLLLVDDQRNSR